MESAWYQRNIEELAQESLQTFPVTVLQGARQVGKSSLAQRMLTERGKIVTLDDPAAITAADTDLTLFVDQFAEGTLVIDEVQLRPEILTAVKASVDRDRRPGRFLLTGSANLLRLRGAGDSLAGRAVTIPLEGLSQGELQGRQDDFVTWLLRAAPQDVMAVASNLSRPQYVEILGAGGYPEMQHLSGRMRRLWLDSYIERVLERDASTVQGGTSRARLRHLSRLLAANQSGELVKARLADQVEVAQSTVTSYLDALESVYLMRMLRPWSPNLTTREVSRPKALITDTALALRLAQLNPADLLPLSNTAIGGFVEGLVVGELFKQQRWSTTEYSLYHYRDRTGVEVDVVVELPDGRVLGIEVKASSTHKTEHVKGLLALKKRLGDRMVAGVVLGMGQVSHRYAEGLYSLPISALWSV